MMMSLLYHMGMVWVGTESAIIRWNAQSYRRLDVLNRNGKPLHCVNSLISVEDNVWSLTSMLLSLLLFAFFFFQYKRYFNYYNTFCFFSSGDNMIQIWTVQGEWYIFTQYIWDERKKFSILPFSNSIKIVEHRHRMLDIFPCGDQVHIEKQALIYMFV